MSTQIPIHIPVPTNPQKFIRGEVIDEFTLILLLNRSTAKKPTFNIIYFKTPEGNYRVERGHDNRLYLFAPKQGRYELDIVERLNLKVKVGEKLSYGTDSETGVIEEIIGLYGGLKSPQSTLPQDSKLYKLPN